MVITGEPPIRMPGERNTSKDLAVKNSGMMNIPHNISQWFCVLAFGKKYKLNFIDELWFNTIALLVTKNIYATNEISGFHVKTWGWVPRSISLGTNEGSDKDRPHLLQDEWLSLYFRQNGEFDVKFSEIIPEWLRSFLPLSKLKVDPDEDQGSITLPIVDGICVRIFGVDIFNWGIKTDMAEGGMFYPVGFAIELIVLGVALYLMFRGGKKGIQLAMIALQMWGILANAKFKEALLEAIALVKADTGEILEKIKTMGFDIDDILAAFKGITSDSSPVSIIKWLKEISDRIGLKHMFD